MPSIDYQVVAHRLIRERLISNLERPSIIVSVPKVNPVVQQISHFDDPGNGVQGGYQRAQIVRVGREEHDFAVTAPGVSYSKSHRCVDHVPSARPTT